MADQNLKSVGETDKGIARIKPEFIVTDHVPHLAKDCLSNDDKNKLSSNVSENATNDAEKSDLIESDTCGLKNETMEQCDPRNESSLEPPQKKHLSKSERKKLRGQNKARPPPFKVNREVVLCHTLVDILEGEEPVPCGNLRCTNMHDVKAFMAIRPQDIGTTCYNFETRGRCPRGLTCRYGSSHISENGFNMVNKTVWDTYSSKLPPTQNILSKELQVALRKRTYDFKLSEKVLEESKKDHTSKGIKRTIDDEVKLEQDNTNSTTISQPVPEDSKSSAIIGPVSDEDIIKPRKPEKKTIDWRGKVAMSPLTTVGNLPFRRICKEFGVDITCGEMAMAVPLLQGMNQEWALVKKHESEDIFGVQLCGNNPYTMTKCAQVLQENIQVDFIDINMGCPIDLVYREGGGSGLLHREKVLQSIVRSMSKVMTIPLTVKTRTGIVMGKNIAHNFMPYFRDLGASLITVHGRSREQRYTRSADWDYIDECAKIAQPVPLFGNGDILSYEDYKHVTETYENISGVMIGRGALIKPWIFTEIKEKKLWDISSRERLDILKKYVNYGLEHWGSDTKGVESTRRFLLEWLSFLHRYIPVGILERPPQKINERPPVFKGRDDLETLMASPNCAHWIEISEMLLGPVPEGFHFLPKHKANSWK